MVIDLREIRIDEPPQPRRVRLIALLSVAVIGVAAALAFFSQRDPVLAELRVRQDRVMVSVQETDYKRASGGQSLSAGDALRTDASGQGQIDFFDTSITRLDSQTTVAIAELTNESRSRRIAQELRTGRIWNNVSSRTSSGDHFEVRGGDTVASVKGTKFIVDGRQAPIWYYIGQEGLTDVTVSFGEKFSLGEGDCVRVDTAGSRRCSSHELDALIDDWVRENQALDELAAAELSPTPSVSPSPTATTGSGTSRVGRRSGTGAPAAPAPAPATRAPRRPAARPAETAEPTNEPADTPRATPTNTPQPTPTPVETPEDDSEADEGGEED